MSAELNSKIGAQSGSMDADVRSPEPMAGDESEVPVTQAQLDVGSVCGSSAAESAASVAGLSFPSSDMRSALDLGPERLQALSPECGQITDLSHVHHGGRV